MLKEVEQRIKSYLSKSDEEAIEEALHGQTSEVKLKAAEAFLADPQDRENYLAKLAADEQGRQELLATLAAADPDMTEKLRKAGLL
jgi:hypothetical protein